MTENEVYIQRLQKRVVTTAGPLDTPCWISTAASNGNGYTVMRFHGKREYCHRVAYETMVGPIADGFAIDHLCRNRACVNPAHLEAVTYQENMRRSDAPSGKTFRTDRCKRGHDLTVTAYHRPDGKGRDCRACADIREGRAA